MATRVLGVDPGLNITGYGVLEMSSSGPRLCEAGVIRAGGAKLPIEQRLDAIFGGISEVLASYQPESVAVEQLYSHYERPQTAILMGHARGVICLAAIRANAVVHHYAATQVKRMLTGSGRASKEQ
ncbi:MAG: crossover junction endodeoxyribonuclease RuvC, partial [Pirellulaceae bacterium]|nr:crossover junction endodeoxyribonuclease RuvC [Pirellulaceae bacterium]